MLLIHHVYGNYIFLSSLLEVYLYVILTLNNPICKAGSSTIVISPHNELISPCYHLNKEQFKINNNLDDVYSRIEVQQALSMEGKFPECEACAINCYMQPSFAIELNKYFWKALPSTIKYNRIKGTWKQLIN